MSPPAVPGRQPSSEFSTAQRSQTPDKSVFSKPAPRPYRSGSGGNVPLHGHSSSEDRPYVGLPRPQSVNHFGDMPKSTQPSSSSSFLEPSYNQDRRMSLGGPIPRPSSQPHFDDRSRRAPLFSPVSQQATAYDDAQHKAASLQRTRHGYLGLEAQPPPRFGVPPGERERYLHEQVAREQEHASAAQLELRHQQQSQTRYGPELPQRESERQLRHPWEPGFQRVSPESTRGNERPSNFGFGAIQDYTKSLGSQLPAPRSVPGGPPLNARQEPTPPNEASPAVPGRNHPPARLYSPTSGGQKGQLEEQQRGPGDEVPQHRSLLNINAENKRTGRASPLPQAVQGAQAQPLGPAAETGINELGRVFSGIGSGVGVSAPIGSGPPTPLNSSPFKRDVLTAQVDGDLTKAGRAGSTSRRRKGKVEEANDSELAIARGLPRKGRHIHHHHHHHHPHPHQ